MSNINDHQLHNFTSSSSNWTNVPTVNSTSLNSSTHFLNKTQTITELSKLNLSMSFPTVTFGENEVAEVWTPPGNRTDGEWLQCHGMACSEWKRVRSKLLAIKASALDFAPGFDLGVSLISLKIKIDYT